MCALKTKDYHKVCKVLFTYFIFKVGETLRHNKIWLAQKQNYDKSILFTNNL